MCGNWWKRRMRSEIESRTCATGSRHWFPSRKATRMERSLYSTVAAGSSTAQSLPQCGPDSSQAIHGPLEPQAFEGRAENMLLRLT
jgi:hypothetical protein